MDKSICVKEIQDRLRELKTLSNRINGEDQCKMNNQPTTVSSTERRILAFQQNPDGTITKFYTLRKTRGPEKLGQNPLGCTATYSMREFCPPSGRTPNLPAKVGSTPPQGRRIAIPSSPACAPPSLRIYNFNPKCRPSPQPLSESALEEGAWGPKPQSSCPQKPSPPDSVAVNRMLKACQKVRGIPPPPPCKSPYSKPSSSAEQSETENDYGYDKSSSGSSPYKLPSHSSPCGAPIAPICMNRATGAIPKNPFRKRPPGPPTPAMPSSPVNIIFMTPYQLTESGLLKQLPCAQPPPPSAAAGCSEQAIAAPQNDLNFTCGEATPKKPTARKKLLFDSYNDQCLTLPAENTVRPTSKTSKCCSAKQLKSCLRKLLSKKESSCRSSEESDDADEECDDDDGDDNEDGEECEPDPPCRKPKESMRKLTVITRKNEFGKEVNEIIEEDFFPDNSDGGVSVRSIVKGVDPSNYLERRIAQFQKENAECGAPKKGDKTKSKCCPCAKAQTKAIENSECEEPEDQTLNEVINTTIKSFELIANVLMKKPLVKCVSNLPSDKDKLNKLLQESINRTESNMSLLRKNLTNALAELSTIFARRAKKSVPEIEDLIKHFEKRMCPESSGGKKRSSKSLEGASQRASQATYTVEAEGEQDVESEVKTQKFNSAEE